jgi:hypothetical protein
MLGANYGMATLLVFIIFSNFQIFWSITEFSNKLYFEAAVPLNPSLVLYPKHGRLPLWLLQGHLQCLPKLNVFNQMKYLLSWNDVSLLLEPRVHGLQRETHGFQKFEEAEKAGRWMITWWVVRSNRYFKRQNSSFSPCTKTSQEFRRKGICIWGSISQMDPHPKLYSMKVLSLSNLLFPRRET